MSNNSVRKDGIKKGLIASLIGAVVLMSLLLSTVNVAATTAAEPSVTPLNSPQETVDTADGYAYTENYVLIREVAFVAMMLIVTLAMLGDIFGSHPEIKILDVFGECRRYDLTVGQLASFTKLSRATVQGKLEELIKKDLVIHTRTIGKNKLYMLAHNEITEQIERLAIMYNIAMIKKEEKEKGKLSHQEEFHER